MRLVELLLLQLEALGVRIGLSARLGELRAEQLGVLAAERLGGLALQGSHLLLQLGELGLVAVDHDEQLNRLALLEHRQLRARREVLLHQRSDWC